MKESIEKRLAKIEDQLKPKLNWTQTTTMIYRHDGKDYIKKSPNEVRVMTIIGMNPGAI